MWPDLHSIFRFSDWWVIIGWVQRANNSTFQNNKKPRGVEEIELIDITNKGKGRRRHTTHCSTVTNDENVPQQSKAKKQKSSTRTKDFFLVSCPRRWPIPHIPHHHHQCHIQLRHLQLHLRRSWNNYLRIIHCRRSNPSMITVRPDSVIQSKCWTVSWYASASS